MNKRMIANIPSNERSPLEYVIANQSQSTMEMVQEAITHNQTLLAFQPVMHGINRTTPAFYEGLIRVLDATGRVIPAGEFMGRIEDTEIGRQIDVLALRHGLTTLRNNPGIRLSINMSARSIGYRPWMNCLNRFLNEVPNIGERLILEISEASTMTVPELVIDFMNRLQPNGICFALDNFGSGNLAIRYFKDFDFDILKISGQFIRGIARNPDNQAVVRALHGIAEQFEMFTVAESVETAADAAVIMEIGINCLQGYYFAAPTTMPDWLRNSAPAQSA
ncbi:MAG: EAL domain-containing protein [Sulfitobacter sp.]